MYMYLISGTDCRGKSKFRIIVVPEIRQALQWVEAAIVLFAAHLRWEEDMAACLGGGCSEEENAEQQKLELEALQSIYSEEITILKEDEEYMVGHDPCNT